MPDTVPRIEGAIEYPIEHYRTVYSTYVRMVFGDGSGAQIDKVLNWYKSKNFTEVQKEIDNYVFGGKKTWGSLQISVPEGFDSTEWNKKIEEIKSLPWHQQPQYIRWYAPRNALDTDRFLRLLHKGYYMSENLCRRYRIIYGLTPDYSTNEDIQDRIFGSLSPYVNPDSFFASVTALADVPLQNNYLWQDARGVWWNGLVQSDNPVDFFHRLLLSSSVGFKTEQNSSPQSYLKRYSAEHKEWWVSLYKGQSQDKDRWSCYLTDDFLNWNDNAVRNLIRQKIEYFYLQKAFQLLDAFNLRDETAVQTTLKQNLDAEQQFIYKLLDDYEQILIRSYGTESEELFRVSCFFSDSVVNSIKSMISESSKLLYDDKLHLLAVVLIAMQEGTYSPFAIKPKEQWTMFNDLFQVYNAVASEQNKGITSDDIATQTGKKEYEITTTLDPLVFPLLYRKQTVPLMMNLTTPQYVRGSGFTNDKNPDNGSNPLPMLLAIGALAYGATQL